MESKSAIKVGAVVILAIIVFVGGYLYLSHINPNSYRVRVRFNDTQGLARQGAVRMEGVSVGEVRSVDLVQTNGLSQPIVTLFIDNKYHIPLGSKISISSGILITNPQVVITPIANTHFVRTDGLAMLDGESGGGEGTLSKLDPDIAKAEKAVNTLVNNLNNKLLESTTKINNVLDQANRLVTLSTQTVQYANNVVGDTRVKNHIFAILQNFEDSSKNVKIASNDLRVQLKEVVTGSRGDVDRLAKKLNDVLDRVDSTIDDANTVVKKVTEQVTDPRFQNSLQETADLAQSTLARFNQIAADIHDITGDPELQGNLKKSVANLEEVTEKGKGVATKMDDLLGKFSGGKSLGAHLPPYSLMANISEGLGPSRLRVDADARIGIGKQNLIDLGLYDFGADTRLNLQLGHELLPSSSLDPKNRSPWLLARYGLYASKLGAGLEGQLPNGLGFRTDLWDTSLVHLDAKGYFRVNNNASIWIGEDDIFHAHVPIIGVQLKD